MVCLPLRGRTSVPLMSILRLGSSPQDACATVIPLMTTVHLLSICLQATMEGRRALPAHVSVLPRPRRSVERMENARRREKTGSAAPESCGKQPGMRERRRASEEWWGSLASWIYRTRKPPRSLARRARGSKLDAMSPRVSRYLRTPWQSLPIALCGKDPLLLPMVSTTLPGLMPYLAVNCIRCETYTVNTPLLSRKKLRCRANTSRCEHS
jgi:hypothetical protein